MAKGKAMLASIYYLLTLYLLANACVLFSAQLIDFGFCLVLSALLILISFLPSRDNKHKYLLYWKKGLRLLAVFFLFMTWVSGFVLWQLDHRLDAALEGKVLLVEGQVNGLPEQETRRQTFDFLAKDYRLCEQVDVKLCAPVSLQNKAVMPRLFSLAFSDRLWIYFFRKGETGALPKKIRVALYQHSRQNNAQIASGESYQLFLKLRRPRSSLNFVGFDYETWLFSQGIHANAYVKNNSFNKIIGVTKNFSANISSLRDFLRKKLILHGSVSNHSNSQINHNKNEVSQAKALILALTIGDRSYLSIDNKNLLIKTGTAHLLAISGMHIALMSALAFFIVFNVARSINWFFSLLIHTKFNQLKIIRYFYLLPIKISLSPLKIAAIASLIFASFYALLSGFSLPTQRALITVICYSLGIIFFNKINFYYLWGLAMLLVAIADPFAIMSSGFYLSFIAVFIIQWVLLGHYYHHESPKLRKFINLLKTQWAVFIGLMPLSMLFFSGFFPLALLCNLFAVPLVSFIVLPFSLLASFLLIFNSDTALIHLLIDYSLFLSESGIHVLIAALSFMLDFFPKNQPATATIISAISLLLFVLTFLSPLPMRLKLLALVFLVPLVLNMTEKAEVPEKAIRVRMLDVGQGLSLIIETQHHLLLYDTGPAFGDSFDAGSAIIMPELLGERFSFRKKDIDSLVLSHGDNDHIGGASSILEHFKVQQILGYRRNFHSQSGAQFARYSHWQDCEEGQSWTWEGVTFQILYPSLIGSTKALKSNNLSCVLLIQAQNFSILLPGDIEKQAETVLLEIMKQKKLQVDVLVAAHHGSHTSSSRELLEQIKPGLVLVSAGFKNQFGHPHKDVLERYKEIGAQVLLTANTGGLLIESWQYEREKPLDNIQKAREQRNHFWRF